jgi:hypothetical protein
VEVHFHAFSHLLADRLHSDILDVFVVPVGDAGGGDVHDGVEIGVLLLVEDSSHGVKNFVVLLFGKQDALNRLHTGDLTHVEGAGHQV